MAKLCLLNLFHVKHPINPVNAGYVARSPIRVQALG
jgi:hypothetical protein